MRALSRLRDGLVGAWCPSVSGWGGNVLRDLSGQGNHGTLTNMDPATDWVVGSNGYQVLDFDGTDDNVTIDGIQNIIGGLDQVSMVFWAFRPSSGTGLMVQCSVSNQTNKEFGILHWTDNQIYFAIQNGNLTFPFVQSATFSGWIHYALSFDGRKSGLDRVIAIVNGVQRSLTLGPGTFPDAKLAAASELGPLKINRNDKQNFQGRGQNADLRIWNRSLTFAEIRTLYNGGPGFGLRPERKRRYVQGQTFTAARLRRQSLIGSGVY